MRYFKAAVGIVVLLVAIWVIVGEQLTGASADATINAPVTLARAPIGGTLSVPERQIGSSVVANDVLATVSDESVDHTRLADLQMELGLEQAALARMQAEATGLRSFRDRLQQRTTAFQAGRIQTLTLELKFARERLALQGPAASKAVTDPGAAPSGSGKNGAASTGTTAGRLALNRAQERVAVLEEALAAAQKGTYLGDGYNDAPYSEQQTLLLDQNLADLKAREIAQKQRVAVVAARLKQGKGDAQIDGTRDILAHVDGIYWQELAHNGGYVNRGDPVARVADCDRVLVTASVPEITYQRLHRGQKVTFRALGENRLFEGYVLRLAGSGAATVYEGLAVAPSRRHLQRFDVAVAVPGLAADPDLQCAIGRTGRVFFQTSPLDFLRSLF
ncbi:MAG: HlyD family efflux transporter periplasmic adaptor subunit [Allgaiera sp.]|jgi:multidrug resistance efflux pump|nr:HlyD family efflux transporter periplasmic adaptor subunit [Allgaiera sp.]